MPNNGDEFISRLSNLINAWCDQRNLPALAHVLPSYVDFNGLTDGWADLRSALKSARSSELDASDMIVLDDLIREANEALGWR